MMRLALLPVVFLFLLPGYTYAQDAATLRTRDAGVLKDVGLIGVIVEDLPLDFESLGLQRNDIQRDVELKLRLAGITIDDDFTIDENHFYVRLGGACTSVTCGYSVRIYYIESVFVSRGDEFKEVVGAVTVTIVPGT